MLRPDLNATSDILDRDVHAIAASLNGTMRVEAVRGAATEQTEDGEGSSPVILQRRASRGLQARLNEDQKPRPFESEEGRRAIEQRLDRLDARLDSISRSVEFSEAFLSLKLKQQLQEILGMSAAVPGGVKTPASTGGWRGAFLLMCAMGSAALLGAEIHSDLASRAAEWWTDRLATLLTFTTQS